MREYVTTLRVAEKQGDSFDEVTPSCAETLSNGGPIPVTQNGLRLFSRRRTPESDLRDYGHV